MLVQLLLGVEEATARLEAPPWAVDDWVVTALDRSISVSGAEGEGGIGGGGEGGGGKGDGGDGGGGEGGGGEGGGGDGGGVGGGEGGGDGGGGDGGGAGGLASTHAEPGELALTGTNDEGCTVAAQRDCATELQKLRAAVNVAAELGPAAGGVGKGARAARILAAVIILVRADGNR